MWVVAFDDDLSLDQHHVGAKAARLSAARRSGFPVLPGFVVDASISRSAMEAGAEALAIRGSGGARLVVSSFEIPRSDELIQAGEALSDLVVARSSTELEGSGRWAGAFSSFLGLDPQALPKAVASIWASAFSPDALERQASEDVAPGSFGIAVLVQPSLNPVFGGVAEIHEDGSVVVTVVDGSPAPLLQGWVRGESARLTAEGVWDNEPGLARFGRDLFDEVARLISALKASTGANRCEWAMDDELWVLQLDVVTTVPTPSRASRADLPVEMLNIGRVVMRFPGRLGRELILPWAIAGMPEVVDSHTVPSIENPIPRAVELSRELCAEVWGSSGMEATKRSSRFIDRLGGPDPAAAFQELGILGRPSPRKAADMMSLIGEAGRRLVEKELLPDASLVWYLSHEEIEAAIDSNQITRPERIGVGRLDPVVADAILSYGSTSMGVPASAGVGVGLRAEVNSDDVLRPRSVVTSSDAVPSLSQLIWDAAGLVTDGGSPAAHIFESARSLGVPAVCGVNPGLSAAPIILAVDGSSGEVASLPLDDS